MLVGSVYTCCSSDIGPSAVGSQGPSAGHALALGDQAGLGRIADEVRGTLPAEEVGVDHRAYHQMLFPDYRASHRVSVEG